MGWGLLWWFSDKESTCNAGYLGDVGSIPGQKELLEEEMATDSSILAWKIPWTGEPGGLSWDGKESDTTEQLNMHTHNRYIHGKHE